MKRTVAMCAALVLGMALQAAAQSLEEKRDKKLQEAFLKKADWITDYDKAREKAEEEDKLIFAYFTRSYAY